MIGSVLIDSILYFMAFIPLVLVPVVMLQLGPYVVIRGISTLMKADAEENSAERYFGIEPEEDMLEPDTYRVEKKEFEQSSHLRPYILMKALSVVTVALVYGVRYSSGVFQSEVMVNFLMNKMTGAFLVGVIFYGASMMALFDQFKENARGRLIECVIFYLDGLVISCIVGIVIASLRF
ncbi:MAG: hypothetical protein JXO44_06025 [Clostridia bacterium]|nr:hypothetical protein [Clostridia bacterium]